MTVTDPVTRTGSESSETATDVVVSGAPASPAGPWPLLAVKSMWAFMQAGFFGLITAAVTLYIWVVKLSGPVGRFLARRLVYGVRAFGRWCGGRGRVGYPGNKGKVTRRTWRRIRVAVWLVLGAGLGWASWALGFATVVEAVRDGVVFAALGFLPGLARAAFALTAPRLYARFDAWTLGLGLRAWVRERWEDVAIGCHLAVYDRDRREVVSKIKTTAAPGVVNVRIRALTGQTVQHIIDAAPQVATAYDAHKFEVTPDGPGHAWLRLFLRNALPAGRTAVCPTTVDLDGVIAGRRLEGTPFRLTLRGRHTLVAGASNSGKGSAFWSIVGGLAPAVPAGLVCLWGIDMKKGVEIGMGPGLFHARAYTHAEALAVLTALVDVIEKRGQAMRGVSRNFEPVPGDPLHVLVIDELADLLSYSEFEVKQTASKLLSIILTQGRALGVIACAFVQDPRQDAVGARNLWTQKIALRLDSELETDMILGSRARQAPAHLINRNDPGTGYLVNEDGTVSMVRFDYWPDDLIRHVAARFPAPTSANLEPVDTGRRARSRSNSLGSLDDFPRLGGLDDDAGNGNTGNAAKTADTVDGAPAGRPKPIRPRNKRGSRNRNRNPQPADAAAPTADVVPLTAPEDGKETDR